MGVKGISGNPSGMASTPELEANRRRKISESSSVNQLRESNSNWRGDEITKDSGRARAERMYKAGSCSECGAQRGERHHKDGNPKNNIADNIAILCRRCHMKADGRLAALAKRASGRSK